MDNSNVLIVGVGGQGTLLTSRIMGSVALKELYDAKISEIHGMAQRGGCVVTHVKIGCNIKSMLIEKREADFIVAFEELEALRWTNYLKDGGKIILNKQKIKPLSVINGHEAYPDHIVGTIKKYHEVIIVNALGIAKKCGHAKAVNVVLLGVLAAQMHMEKEVWIEAIRENVPEWCREVNIKAFHEGFTQNMEEFL